MINKVKYFPIRCCKILVSFTEDMFTFDGKMDVICHKHPTSFISYLTWRAGIDEEIIIKEKEKRQHVSKSGQSS